MGTVRTRRRRRRALQVQDPRRRLAVARQGRPVRVRDRGAAGHRVRGAHAGLRVERRRLARGAGESEPVHVADVDLRGAPRFVARRVVLPRTGRAPRELRPRRRVHPRRVPAGVRAPVRWLVGLPGLVLLRAVVAVRRSGRVPLPRRRAARGRHRRDRRLGAGALPEGRVRARPLRRHAAVRARRPAPRRAARLGHVRLRLRAHRGAQLPRRERGLLARGVPRRRAARRRGRVDALPRLLARRGRVAAQPVRRAREPRRSLVPAGDERDGRTSACRA